MKINRFKFITNKGKQIVKKDSNFDYHLQDKGKTLKVVETKKNNKKNDFYNNQTILISILSSLFTFIFILIFTFLISNTFMIETVYSNIASMNQNDVFVDLTYNRCISEKTKMNKAYCVNEIFDFFYRYKPHGIINNFKSPIDTMLYGGVCRDAAILYCSIFKKMDIKCTYQFTDEHVFNIIDLEDEGYCIIDQTSMKCQYKKDK